MPTFLTTLQEKICKILNEDSLLKKIPKQNVSAFDPELALEQASLSSCYIQIHEARPSEYLQTPKGLFPETLYVRFLIAQGPLSAEKDQYSLPEIAHTIASCLVGKPIELSLWSGIIQPLDLSGKNQPWSLPKSPNSPGQLVLELSIIAQNVG